MSAGPHCTYAGTDESLFFMSGEAFEHRIVKKGGFNNVVKSVMRRRLGIEDHVHDVAFERSLDQILSWWRVDSGNRDDVTPWVALCLLDLVHMMTLTAMTTQELA